MSAPEGLLARLLGASSAGEAKPATTPVKALVWARVSTEMQEERGLSIPEQLREIRVYAEAQGIEIVAEFQEAASAFQREEKRVELHRMIARAVNDPQVNAILVHDLSRFSRDSARARDLMRDLRAKGVRVISLNDPEFDPETVSGVYVEAITFARNEAFSREIAFHTRKGCRANVQTRDPETGWCYKNGGVPLWGYRLERLQRGEDRRGVPITKVIWLPDETVAAGRAMHEWARYCLVEMAARGTSLDAVRDFCNEAGLPARRGGYWSTSTWHSLLEPSRLLGYCGYGVWNVKPKRGRPLPPSEGVIVPRAHPALLTQEEACAIAAVRRERASRSFDAGCHRSRSSPYLLSGGLFVCGRCGSNMIGFRSTRHKPYYVCGSQPYRKSMGCGPGVYVPQALVEGEVVAGMQGLVQRCADPKGFTRQVNEELRRLWEARNRSRITVGRELRVVENRIANIRKAVEEGLADVAWANRRMQELVAERAALGGAAGPHGQPPQIDVSTAVQYRRQLDSVLACGDAGERKRFVRMWVEKVELDPNERAVEIRYRVPDVVVNNVVPGPGFEPGRADWLMGF